MKVGGEGSQESITQLVIIILLQTKLFHVCVWTGNLSPVSLLEQAMEMVGEFSVKDCYKCRFLSISKDLILMFLWIFCFY